MFVQTVKKKRPRNSMTSKVYRMMDLLNDLF